MTQVPHPIFEHISRNDAFARLLGAVHDDIRPGYARVTMTVRADMLNFHGTTHGGALSALSAVAVGAAANSHGQAAVGININIDYISPTSTGAALVAEAREISVTGPIALYDVQIHSQDTGELVAHGKGTLQRRKDQLIKP
jgi:acyl-CoA thioesterase